MDRRAHSITEIQLFFLLTPCPACGLTALRPRSSAQATSVGADHLIGAACARCLRDFPDRFAVAPLAAGMPAVRAISAWHQPSELIDVVGWIALYGILIEQSWQEPDKRMARRLAWEAGLCLDEALKFYPPGERYPVEAGFFTDASRARFKSFREQFDRDVVLHHRRQAPTLSAAEARGSEWAFWEKYIAPRTGWQPEHG